jgi:Sulfotransferase domain
LNGESLLGCAFLGVPVPEGKPFPHLNDAAEFRVRLERDALFVRTVGYTAVGVAALALILIALMAIRRWS